MANKKKIKVFIKVRPLIQREKNENLSSQWSLVNENTIKSNNTQYKYSFDHIFDEKRSTEELFNTVAKPIVENAVKGINGTIFAYGQTSSGKTYCMMGTDEEPGIIPLTINEIFKQVELTKEREFLIRVGYIEIYNERIFDLLSENKQEINKIHETNGEVSVNQTEILSSTAQHILDCYNEGSKERQVGETCMNERSSRSHTIFRIVIESHENENKGIFQVSTLNLVDLAGSERADQTKATGERLREGGLINKSLLALSKVIRELSDLTDDKTKTTDGTKYINYRDSKLTRILSASLGGNAMTAIICTITPCALEESYSTLTFASNAKKIKNQPKVNETVSDKVIMARLQKEITDLRKKLEEEKSKKSESEYSKINRLLAQIFDRENQIIHHHSEPSPHTKNPNRRRTWCPESHMEKIIEESTPNANNFLMAPPPFILKQPAAISPIPDVEFMPTNDFMENEMFRSPTRIKFDDNILMISPRRQSIPSQFHTPKCLRPVEDVESPYVGKPSIEDENKILKKRINYLQDEIDEMNYFKVIEENAECKILQEKLDTVQAQLTKAEEKIEMLEIDVTDKMIEIETLGEIKEKCEVMENECKKAVQDRERAENILASVQYEYDQAKAKFKTRETELTQCLDEARNETSEAVNVQKEKIKSLEQVLRKTEEDLFALESQKTAALPIDSKKIIDLEMKISDLQKQLAEKNSEIETLSEQIMDAVQDTDRLQNKITNLEQVIKSNDAKILELEGISNRYQKIQQIVTVSETVSEMYYDENDDVFKCIVQLQQSATKTETLETENKQLLTQIAENNRINEEVENLHQQINALEEAIKCKDSDYENLSTKHENLTNRLDKIQQLLMSNTVLTNDDEADEICQLIIKLHRDSSKIENLNAEKLQLLSKIEENCNVHQELTEVRNKIEELEEIIKDKDIEKQNLTDQFATQLKQVQDALQNDELPPVEDDTDSICRIIINLRQELNKCKQDEEESNEKEIDRNSIEILENKIGEFEQVVKNNESERAHLLNKLSDCEVIVGQFQKIQEMIKTLDEDNLDDGNFDVCAIITKLHENLIHVKKLVAEKDELLSKMTESPAENEDTIILEGKIKDLEEIIKLKDVEKDALLVKFLEHEKTAEQFQKIQDFLVNNDALPESIDENEEIIKAIVNLRMLAEKANTLEVEKQKILTEVAEVEQQNSHKTVELEKNIHNLKESIELKEAENIDLNAQLTEQKGNLQKFEKVQQALVNNETITEDYFDDNFGKLICKLHQTASRSESLEYEKQQLLNELAEIRSTAEILSDKLLANQTLSETEYQLREKIDVLEVELKDAKEQLDVQIVKNSEFESAQLDLQIKIEEVQKDKEEMASQIFELKKSLKIKCNDLQKLNEQLNESATEVQSYECDVLQLISKLDAIKVENAKLLEADGDYTSQLTKLDAELTNSRSQLVLKEEEFKKVQKELAQNIDQLKGKAKELDDLKLRYRRRSEDNVRKLQELEITNNKLLQEVGAAEALKVLIENDLKKLKDQYGQLLIENKSLKDKNNDNDMKFAILDEKFSQLCSINSDLESKLKDKINFESRNMSAQKKLEREIVELHEKINEQTMENDEKKKMIIELHEKCERLVKENELRPKKSSSPTHRRSDEKELFDRHLTENHNNIGTPARTVKSNIDRKSRRQSVYDERRDLSAWELTESASTQTDPVDRLCACDELANKIKDLNIEIRMRDCKIANAERMANVNIYKYELEDVKTECQQLKIRIGHLQKLEEALKAKTRENQMRIQDLELNQKSRNIHSRGTQTDYSSEISKTEYERVVNERSFLEKKLAETKKQLSQEKEKIIFEKENVSTNTSSNRLQEFTSKESGFSETSRIEYENLVGECEALKKKYTAAKQLCNLRMDDLKKVNEELREKNLLHDTLNIKYGQLKEVLERRLKKLRLYRARYGELDDTTLEASASIQ